MSPPRPIINSQCIEFLPELAGIRYFATKYQLPPTHHALAVKFWLVWQPRKSAPPAVIPSLITVLVPPPSHIRSLSAAPALVYASSSSLVSFSSHPKHTSSYSLEYCLSPTSPTTSNTRYISFFFYYSFFPISFLSFAPRALAVVCRACLHTPFIHIAQAPDK